MANQYMVLSSFPLQPHLRGAQTLILLQNCDSPKGPKGLNIRAFQAMRFNVHCCTARGAHRGWVWNVQLFSLLNYAPTSFFTRKRGWDSGPFWVSLKAGCLLKTFGLWSRECKKSSNSCAKYLGECGGHSVLVRGLCSITSFAFNYTISLSLHQLGIWHFLFEKGSISKKWDKYLGKHFLLIIETCLSNKTSAK